MLVEFTVILVLVLFNGMLAGAEIAIVGLDRTRLAQLVERGGRRAQAVRTLRSNPERFFATVQVGITVIGATAGAFGGATFAEDIEPLLARIPSAAPYAEGLSVVLVVAMLSLLSVVFGELVPKSLALRHAEAFSTFFARPILWLSWAARPIVWFLTTCSNLVLGLFGGRTTFAESRLSPEELGELVTEAAETGSIHPAAGEIAARALEFSTVTAEQVMVPRPRVVALPVSSSPQDVKRITLEHGYSRLPVYGSSLDDVVGYVMVKDMLAMAWEGRLIVLKDLLRPPLLVVEKTPAPVLLQQMREQRTHIAMVIDERGGTSGIVTMEDLLEELVGEIFSELATESEPIRRRRDGSAIIQGDVSIRDVNRALQTELAEGDGWSTIGGLCMALAERVPRKGDILITSDGTRIEVEAASERAVLRVRVWPVQGAETST